MLAGTLVGCNCLQYRPSERPRELALIVDRSNEVVVAFHLHRRAGRPPLVYHRGVKAISTLVAHSPGEYAKVRLGSGERILISTSQQSVRNLEALVRGSSRCDDIRPIKEGYGRAGKGANDDHDLAGNAGARHLWSYFVASSQRVRVRQRYSPAFQRGLRIALSACEEIHPDPCSIPSIARTSPSGNRTYPICMGRASSSRQYLRARAACIWRGAALLEGFRVP